MDRCDDYKASLTREQFLFYEIRVAARLLSEGNTRQEATNRIIEDNLFQFPTERMISSIANTCYKRLDFLNSSRLVDCIANGDVENAKLINLYAMMRSNKIVWDFMITVIGEKYRTQDFSIEAKDFNLFMMSLHEQNEYLTSCSDKTVTKIKQVLKKSIAEAGYLDSTKSTILNPVLAGYDLIDGIKNNSDYDALVAFNYFE